MIAYITGTSSGIGKALAEKLLEQSHQVIGLSRRQTIKHPNYTHHAIDLSDLKQVKAFEFTANLNDDIVLVNNAGSLGPMVPVGRLIADEIIKINNLNITAPQILCNQFIQKYQANIGHLYHIINISSGAGKRPIDGWANYCASKSAIDLFTQTIEIELKERKKNNWHVYAVSPGVVDTPMQLSIRSSDPKAFLNRQSFIDLKENNALVAPNNVALQLLEIIHNPKKFNTTLVSLNKR
ncbi:short-chain dehydrogenase [Putridiphycobacter roseus]|uniref:Short-chain dehydrogenase n=1 Tax=Putridiphycobacter roseus TaxID=2219161 RepID=A0A2W1N2L4_9FLAO|nr:SDR family NAD(P)-dependent oxidoreductase [Putridiphycobacter roseus]PZE18919.1 short-chain dehydrogenase [Putridiphycobacter roseus]